ncbi:MAG: tRNA pseudouridine(38-40) synthase TruA [Cyanobacteria bacterium P01_F01_bin.33]
MTTTATTERRRIALKVQYLGTQFWGWQRQPRHRSVQGVLEDILASRVRHAVTIHGAGRTDTGVHACGQVAHFETDSPIPDDRWQDVLNRALPEDVAIATATRVESSWHARFSALWRRYRYAIWNEPQPNVFWRLFSWHQRCLLDEEAMASALKSLMGQHDLDVFRCSGSKRADSVVRIQKVRCWRVGPLVWIDVQASGFLYRMMRLLVGALAEVGLHRISTAQFEAMWRQKRSPIRYTAPACGLCLTGVGYERDPFASHSPSGAPVSLLDFPFANPALVCASG